MWYKQQLQLCLIPRILKGIKIAYKGQYSLKFEVIHESDQGTRNSGYPYIYRQKQKMSILVNTNMEMKVKNNQSAIKVSSFYKKSVKQEKRGRTVIQNNSGFYQTPVFQVRYQTHTEYFSEPCIFKLQYKLKKGQQRGRTYLYISLLSHRKQVSENPTTNLLQLQSKTQTLYTKKVNINLHLNVSDTKINRFQNSSSMRDINQFGLYRFCNVQMQDNDFFGDLIMFVGAVHLGWRIRGGKDGLCRFLCRDDEEKKKAVQKQRTYMKSKSQVGKCIRQLTQQSTPTLLSYLTLTIKKSITQLSLLTHTLQSIHQALSQQSSSTSEYNKILQQWQNNYNFLFDPTSTTSEQQKIEQIMDYYQINGINQLYFQVHYYVRMLWLELVKVVCGLAVDVVVGLSGREQQESDLVWKANCIRFISSSVKNQINIRHSHSQSRLALLQLNPKHPHKQIPKSQINSASISLQQIRNPSIQQYQRWRKVWVQKQRISYDQQKYHPLFFIQNYSPTTKDSRSSKDKINKNIYKDNSNSSNINRSQVDDDIMGCLVGEHEVRKKRSGEISLVVFIHGFRGSQYDLEKASEYLLKFNQEVDVLRIRSIQHDIDYTIQQVATIVASQIKKYIITSLSKYNSISLIGYSLGGIIARACLPHLSLYKQKFNLLITFSSPHLGTYATDNNLVKLGIWYMTKFTKCTILQQLHTCRDLKTSSKSYMKILSEGEEISWFKKIVLVSCREDQFVPHVSARVGLQGLQSNKTNLEPNKNSPNSMIPKTSQHQSNQYHIQMQEMCANILKNANKIERVEVWFDNENKKGTLDKLTGRQSHIQFLDNCLFHKWFFQLYAKQL